MNRSTYARLCRTVVVTLLAPLISFAPSVWAPSALPQAHAASCANGGPCSIGDTGPGGGVVFYVAPTNFTEGSTLCSLGCKYLEAAPISGSNGWSDFSTTLWGGSNTSVSGTGTAIGTGYANTAAIVAGSSTAGKAATASTAYRGPNAMSDWFLPSKDELTQMWNQRSAIGIATGGNWYWSSSQSVSCCAYVLKFDANATANDFNKTDSAYVRPIRAFYPYQVPGSISITKTGNDLFGGYTGNDYINFNFPTGHGLNDGRSFTIETWVYLGSSNTYGTVSLTAGDTTAARNEYTKIRRSGFLINPTTGTWFAEGAGTAYCNPTTLTNSISIGRWVNLAYQRSIVAGAATDSIYIDGTLSGSCSVGTSNTNNDTVRIGTTSGNTGTYNTSYFGPTRVIDGEAIYSANFTPSTTFGSYASNSSGTGTTILNLAPTSTVPLTFAETPPYTPTLDYGASYLSSNPAYGSSDKSPPIYTARTLTIDSSSYLSSYSLGITGPTISATASAGSGTKSYSTSTSSVCTVGSTGLVTLVAAGTCSITAQIANDGTYAAATSSAITFSVTAAVPTLSLSLPSGATTATYGTAVTITATMNTAGSVTFKSGGTAITGCSSIASATSSPYTATCSWTPTAVSATTALTADFAPTSSNYSSLTAAGSKTINVGLRPITVTADASQSKVYGASDPTLTYQITSGSLYSTDALTGSLARAAGETVGSYAINIGTVANSKYNITFNSANFSITTSNQLALTFATTSYNLAYGSTQQVTASGGSGTGAISYSAGSSTACSVGLTTGVVTVSAATGTCSISATRAADTNYNSVTTAVPVTITVGKASQLITTTTAAPTGVVVGSASYSPSATAPGGSVVISLDALSSGCSLNTGVVTFTTAGTCLIDFNQAGTANYNPAAQVQQSITVSQGTQSALTFGTTSYTVAYGNTQTVTATGGSGTGAISYSAGSSTACSVDAATGLVTVTNSTGTCSINASKAADANYTAATSTNSVTITVSTRPITVTATSAQSKIYGATDPVLAYTITSGSLVNGDTLSGSLSRAAGENVATYAIAIGTLANSKYSITFGAATTFAITKASQSITITSTAPTSAVVGGATYTPTATAPGGTVAITLDGSSTGCSLSSGVVSFTAAGACLIDFNQAGTANYNPAAQVQQSITIGKGALSVTFGTIPSGVTFGETAGTHLVSATSTPANTGSIVFASTTSAVCTVNSSTGALTIAGAGTCTITANNSGTSNYSAATQVSQSFSVSKATPVLSGFSIPNQNFGVSPITITAPTAAPNIAGAYSYTSATTSVATISGSTLTIASGGSSIITATFTPTDTANYNSVQVTTTLNVGTSSQTISISSTVPASGSISSPTYTPTATAPGGSVAITLDATSTGCSLTAGSVTFSSTGNCLINFNQAGNTNYGAATLVQQSITQYVISCSVSGSFYVTNAVIPSAAGQNCSGTATIPVGITGVAINAFAPGNAGTQTNRALTGLVFPSSGFVNIDQGGFENLGLTSVTVPASVTVVGQYAFQNNPLATAVITGGSGGAATYLGQSAFSNKAYGLGPGGTGVPLALTFGSGNIQVGQNFGSNTTFASVDFGAGLTSIDIQAFKQNGISNWVPTFPDTVTSIGQDAFTYSTIKNIKFGTATTLNLTSISPYAFDQGSLTSVQDCEVPSATTVLHTYLRAYQPQAVIWCNAVVPNAPNNLSSTASSGTVALTWSNGTSQNEAPTTDFTVQYTLTGGSAWSTFAHAPSSSTSITVTGLTNGVSYTFQIAAVNLIGVSAFSSPIQAKPLGVAFSPQFDIPVSTVDGFTVNVTNFDPTYVWDSATVTSGLVTRGVAANGKLPLTVTGMSPGALATLSITASKQNFSDGTNVVTGRALQAALVPVLANVVVTTGGLSATISNFNTDYIWSATATPGTAAISATGAITVTGVNPQTQIRLTVGTARSGYAAGSESTTATTLQLLQVIYNGSSATGGAVPVDTNRYTSNAVATVLGNTGTLSLSGNTFAGWTINSNGTGQLFTGGNTLQLASATINLYAKWTLNPYTVTYNANNATSGTVPVDLSTYTIGQNAPVYGNTGGLTRTGYTFGNWGYNSTETSTAYASGQTYPIGADNVNLYAIWTPNTYTIIYDANGGSGSPSKATDSYTTGSTVISLATVGSLQKIGFDFVGWGLAASSNPIANGGVVATDTRLYAQWRIANFAVTYLVGQNGSGTTPHQDNVNYGSSFTVASAVGLTSSDLQGAYAFVSWMDGSGKTYAPGQSYLMGANSVTLTAQWTRIYNVKYSFNGGSVASAIADQQKISGETITVTSIQPSRDGFNFINWIDQSGLSASGGETYTVNDSHYLLYAQWTAISYPVTYDSNGGNPTPTEPSHVIGDIFTLAAAPSKTGYDFAYWSEGSSHYNAGGTYQVSSHSVSLQAQWTPQVYRISYDFNGGFGTSLAPTDYTFGTPPAALPAKPASDIARTDYTFSGWSPSATATSGFSSFTPSGDIQLHAVWVSSVYRLTFNAGAGFSDSATAKVTIGQAIALPSATRANYTLLGWSTQQSGGTPIPAGTTYTPTSDALLYAQWTLQVFTVTFDGNNGTADRASDSMTYGSQTLITLPSASRTKYVFNGWYSDPIAGYLIGQVGSSYSPSSSITAYAHWVQGSLSGMGAATQIAQVTVHAGVDASFTAGSNGSTVTVNYSADSLPDGTVITAYLENSPSRVRTLLGTTASPVLSLIIAWVAPDGTVPNTVANKPITMTISNPNITAGSKIFGLVANNSNILGIASVDGLVQVAITEDPAVVVAQVAPDSPSNVTAVATSSTSATVSWNAPSNSGGATITQYAVSSTAGIGCTSGSTSCLVTGLTSGTGYSFTVTATNSVGTSVSSSPSAALTLTAQVVVAPSAPAPTYAPAPVDNSAALAEAKALADKQAAALKAAQDAAAKALADKQVADAAALQAAQAQAAADLEAARDKAAADAKAAADEAAKTQAAADAKAAAEAKALADAAIAAQLAARKITPEVTLYSITPKLTLSLFDMSYLKKYLSTLKVNAKVGCIGYTYTQHLSLYQATVLAKKQAIAVCTIIKKIRPTLQTSILIRPAKSAPSAAKGAKWVAVSFRVDGFQPKPNSNNK